MEYISDEIGENIYYTKLLKILNLDNTVSYNDNILLKNKNILYENEFNIFNSCLNKIGKNTIDINAINATYFDSGMQAITTIFSILFNNNQYDKLYIIGPAYDAIYKLCDAFNIKYIKINLYITHDYKFELPLDSINNKQNSCFFITNPIFSICCQYNTNIYKLKNIIQQNSNNIFIFDECIFSEQYSYLYQLNSCKNVIFICSPFKSLGIEFNKFVMVISHKYLNNQISKNKTYLFGLSYTNINLLKTYLSQNYNNSYKYCQTEIINRFNTINTFINKYCLNLYCLSKTFSNCQFITLNTINKVKHNISYADISAKIEKDLNIEIIYNSPCSLYNNEFSFRINLLKNTNIILKSLLRINKYIIQFCIKND